MSEQLLLLPRYLTAHLQLSLAALGLGLAISLPLGLWVTRRPRLEPPVLGIASVLQTIPGLALLALMVPTLAAIAAVTTNLMGIQFSSIGFLPALIALTLYSVLPILRNTVTGISNLDPAYIEAARGVGMTPRQRTLLVELPLALPIMVAGIRTVEQSLGSGTKQPASSETDNRLLVMRTEPTREVIMPVPPTSFVATKTVSPAPMTSTAKPSG